MRVYVAALQDRRSTGLPCSVLRSESLQRDGPSRLGHHFSGRVVQTLVTTDDAKQPCREKEKTEAMAEH